MTVGDTGLAIVIDAGGFDLTGSTAVLIAAPGAAPNTLGGAQRYVPLAISQHGFHAVYTTKATDFLAAGPWQAQLEVTTPAGEVFTSSPRPFYVQPLLQSEGAS